MDPATGDKTTHGTADGRKACLEHCLTYTATQAIVAGSAPARSASDPPGRRRGRPRHLVRHHYVADRRVPGEGLLRSSPPGPARAAATKLADFGMNGAFHLDSAWHHGWETVA
ncbi:hypothetical protein, partial [Streptomyces hydrogenans]|uniref:hypothetical protein n=1 Tax=Streptomyces hydrogenans TaxID=1873719 RepID=UPI001CFEADCE